MSGKSLSTSPYPTLMLTARIVSIRAYTLDPDLKLALVPDNLRQVSEGLAREVPTSMQHLFPLKVGPANIRPWWDEKHVAKA